MREQSTFTRPCRSADRDFIDGSVLSYLFALNNCGCRFPIRGKFSWPRSLDVMSATEQRHSHAPNKSWPLSALSSKVGIAPVSNGGACYGRCHCSGHSKLAVSRQRGRQAQNAPACRQAAVRLRRPDRADSFSGGISSNRNRKGQGWCAWCPSVSPAFSRSVSV